MSSERAFRTEVVVAFLVGVLLIGGGVFVWRRPHAGADPVSPELGPAGAPSAVGAGDAGAGTVDAGPVALSEVHVLGCHDRGSKRTPPDQCDRLPAIEGALSSAIEQAASCVSPSSSSGTIEYVASVSFRQRKVTVSLPRSGRSFHDMRTVDACAASVRAAMQGVGLDAVNHEHARYRFSVVATYRAMPPEGSGPDRHALNSPNSSNPPTVGVAR
ncbi:MAG: hypothetical protein ABTD50_12215 [Polyangiaceae bacterium]